MNVKRVIKKIVEPELLKVGQHLRYSATGLYCFTDSEKSVDISIDVPPLPPPALLQEFIAGYKNNKWKNPPPALCVSYAIKRGIGYHNLVPSRFILGEQLNDAVFYTNQQELESAAQIIVQQATTWILPFLYRMVDRMVYPTAEMYQQLEACVRATTPEAKCDSIDGNTLKKMLHQADQSLIDLLPEDDDLREEVFMAHLKEIIQIAHVAGNAILQNKEGEWNWVDYKKYNLYVPPSFCLQYMDGNECNVLQHLINLWNFYPKIKYAGLQFGCRVQ